MKICVISSTVFPLGTTGLSGYGGLEMVAWERARGLAARGHQVALVAPEGSVCPGAEVISNGQPGQWNEQQAFALYHHRLPEFDVVVDDSWQKHSYLMKAEGKLNAPVLGVLHAPTDSMWKTLPPVRRPCVVSISEDQGRHFDGLFSRDYRVAYNGIDPEVHRPLNTPRTGRFLFLARFSTIKGADIALEACYRAGVGLDLIGDTSITNEPQYFENCKKMAERTSPGWDPSRGKQFRIVGGVSRGETVWWYSQARAMLHPNQRFREPFGLAPVEAMACGCPVVAWKYGAMRETVKHGETGFLVESMDELVEAIKSPWMGNVGDGRRASCREWAGRFSIQNMVTRYEQLCEEALATGGW